MSSIFSCLRPIGRASKTIAMLGDAGHGAAETGFSPLTHDPECLQIYLMYRALRRRRSRVGSMYEMRLLL